jgi:phospholipid-binding lipoprotein MlaA
VPATASAQEAVYDPWEGMNRDLYAVHDAVDRAVLEPVAEGYRAVIPSPARQGVRNFLRNLRSPVIFVNDVLQAEPNRAGTTAARFGINTTVGVLGLFDPATSFGLERHDEDFGQTLAVWGVGEGPYIFVPVLGPTNLRDGVGRVVDIAFDPLTWADFDEVETVRLSRTLVAGVDAREGVLEAVDDVRNTSIDPYVTFRTTYGTLREGQILNGRVDTENLPNFDDSFETLESPTEAAPPEAPSPDAPAAATEGAVDPKTGPSAAAYPQHFGSIETPIITASLEGVGSTPTSAHHPGETP